MRRRAGSILLLAGMTAGIVVVLGTFVAAAASSTFADLAGYRVPVKAAFTGASIAMTLFVALSGWFMSEHYLAGRRRELALLQLAGMRKRHVLCFVSAELGMGVGAGFAAGLAASALLSRFFALVLGALMRTHEAPSLYHGALSVTVIGAACALQLILAVARAGLELSRCTIAWLLRSERDPEEPRHGRRVRAALAALLLACSYALACLSRGSLAENLILPLLSAAVCGTFLAFDSLLPTLAEALRTRALGKSAAAIFAAAQIAFRSRRNARLLALAAVLMGSALSAVGTVIVMAQKIAAEGTYDQDEIFGSLLFIGGFLSTVLILSVLALLVSRAAADARDDLERKVELRDLGASRAVMLRAIDLQNAFLFGLPLAFGLAHAAAALAMLRTFSNYSTAPAYLYSAFAAALITWRISRLVSRSQLERLYEGPEGSR